MNPKDPTQILPRQPEGAEAPLLPCLMIVAGGELARRFYLDRHETVVGRDEGTTVTLADPGISRRHARFLNCDGRTSVEDLGSTNGTLVNGERVRARLLAEGDLITLGGVTLKFHRLREVDRVFYDRLLDSATRDELTGLYNRRVLLERLEGELSRCRRYDRPLSLLLLDLDHFKTINDTRGHPAGDRVLQAVARTLECCLRVEPDLPARYGGEEFAVLLPEVDREGARRVAEKLRRAVESLEIPLEPPLRVTASIGVTSLEPIMAGGDELIRQADRQLYAAKHRGRNRVEG